MIKNFVKDVSVFHCDGSKEDGSCKSKFENSKITGVIITIEEEKSERACRDKIFHEAKHAQQYFQKGRIYVEEIDPVYTEIEAYAYQFKRSIEEDLKTVYRKLRGLFSKN